MTTQKKFKCKNEELVVICDYLQTSFLRDLAEFTAYSPRFNEWYLAEFKRKNEAMNKIVFPQDKTKELKTVTARLYANMDKLVDWLDRLEGYIKFAKDAVPLSAADFGTLDLKKKIRSRDAEGTLKHLQRVNENIETYKKPLAEQGLSSEAIAQLSAAFAEIDAANQKQYELASRRRLLAAENINLLNELYAHIMEICETGKILYRKTHQEKLPDYTFAYLIKKVRIVQKKVSAGNDEVSTGNEKVNA